MFYLVYKTTNLVNGKSYIGCHQTRRKDDAYLGSGVLLKKAIAKYGAANFKKDILFEATSPAEMFAKEKELVTIGPSSYNLAKGGFGGFDHCNSPEGIESRKHTFKRWYKAAHKRWKEKFLSDENFAKNVRENIIKAGKCQTKSSKSFLNKKHSEKTKRKIGAANSKLLRGAKNPMYGMQWITCPATKENTRIKKDQPIPVGWIKGRIIRKAEAHQLDHFLGVGQLGGPHRSGRC